MIWVLLLFIVLFLLFAIGPVWYQGSSAQNDAENSEELDEYAAENLRLYQERIKELEESTELSEIEKQELQLELDREFLASEQFKGYQQSNAVDIKGRLWLPLAMAGFLAFASLGLYSFWGASSEITAAELLKDFSSNPDFSKTDELKLLDALEKAALDNPKKLEWGYYYGRLNMEMGNYNKARTIYTDLLEAVPAENEMDRMAILNMLIQATFFANNQQPSAEAYVLIKQSLAIEPNQPQFLGLAGMMAFEMGEFKDAIKYWKTLWQSLPDDPNTDVIEQGIQRAAAHLEEQGEEVDLSFLKRTRLTVMVDISPEAKASAPANTIVFVSAVAFEGPPMPLAAQRLTLAQLPTQVVLSDAQAVMPNMNLSAFENVSIKATLSVSGQPKAQKGDWQGEVSPVKNTHEGVLKLIIDTKVQ